MFHGSLLVNSSWLGSNVWRPEDQWSLFTLLYPLIGQAKNVVVVVVVVVVVCVMSRWPKGACQGIQSVLVSAHAFLEKWQQG
jgi:hypothetical protein